MSDILIISNNDELDTFCNTYSTEAEPLNPIDWQKVSEDYKGIELINYQSLKASLTQVDQFLTRIWVTAWDVNGGCIWDMSVISKPRY